MNSTITKTSFNTHNLASQGMVVCQVMKFIVADVLFQYGSLIKYSMLKLITTTSKRVELLFFCL